MRQLAVVQFFSWFALFAMWIYTTNGVTADKYNMKIDSEMLNFLKTELANIQPDSNTVEQRIKDISEELKKYETKISEKKSVSANVNLVKFYLNNRIYNEKYLVNQIKNSLRTYSSKEKDYEAAMKEINDLSTVNNPDISFKTISYINKLLSENRIILSTTLEKFSKYTRLKEIREEYNIGANWVGVGFGVYNGFAAVFAFLLILLARLTNRKITHMISLLVGGLSFIMLFFIQDTSYLLLAPFIGIGLAWASILSMPYAILTGSLPANKMGVFMGIFNFFIVIPQILAASILGFLVKSVFGGEAIYALILGGISLALAAFFVLVVKDDN